MKEAVKNLQPYIPEKPLTQLQDELGLDKIVRLSANENPYGTSPTVKQAVVNWAYSQSNRYPDGDATELRDLISKKFDLNPEQIVFGVGLDEVIVMLSRVFLEPGAQELISSPTFSEYSLHAEIEQAVVKKVATKDNGQVNFDALLKNVTDLTKLIWICNPNNPTGTFESVSDIEEFVQKVPKDTLVLIDEAYIDFVSKPNASAMELTKKYPNIVVMRTFSKAYGLANFRVGYAVFAKKIAEQVQKVRLPYNINSVAQVAATAAFKDQDFVDKVIESNQIERTKLENFFVQQNINYFPSQANFVFFQYPDAEKLANYLLHNGYLLRTGLRPGWLRLTVGIKDDNQNIIKLISEYGKK